MQQQRSLVFVLVLIFAMTALLVINPFGRNLAAHDEVRSPEWTTGDDKRWQWLGVIGAVAER